MHPADTSLRDLLDVRHARLVVIHDIWVGYNPHSPVAAVYELHRRSSGGLSGEGRLSTSLAKPKTVRISMTAATAGTFLDALASARLSRGDYHPFQDHTDDYPRIEIALHVGAGANEKGGLALLYTESQGELHTPWAAFVAGTTYTIDGDEVGRALRSLDRSLQRAELRRLMDC